jgi:hypothetical protein
LSTRQSELAMPSVPERLYHFSEDRSIERFEPNADDSGTGVQLVWGIDADHEDLYFFPRDCPRVAFHGTPDTSREDYERFLSVTTAHRVSAIEAAWLDSMRTTQLYRYVLPGDGFELRDANAGYWGSRFRVEPIHVGLVGDLLGALAGAGVELRIMPSLWPLYEAVLGSSLGFSVIRWRNALPRPDPPSP